MKAYQRKHNLYSRYFIGDTTTLVLAFINENAQDYRLWVDDPKAWLNNNVSASDVKEILKEFEYATKNRRSKARTSKSA